jgi:hypothetical protein
MTPHQYRNRVERKRLKLERKYIALLEKVFNKQLNDFTKAIEDNLYGAVYSIDIYFNDVLLERALTRLWQETAEEFRIDNVEEILVKSINPSTWSSLLGQWIATTGAEKIKTINGFTREFVLRKLRPVLNQGVQEGLGIPEIARNIIAGVKEYQGAFAKYRATRIARTEIVGMSNRSSLMSAESAGLKNRIEKFWIPFLDNETRDSHEKMAEHDAIPLNESFDVGLRAGGTEKLMYPGDPEGSAENVINCFPADQLSRINPNNIKRIYRSKYKGFLIKVKLSNGGYFTCTPNHPILTDKGWISAKEIDYSTNIIDADSIQSALGNFDINNVPISISEVFDSFSIKGICMRVGRVNVNFHGDIPDSDVDIINIKSLLQNRFVFSLPKFIEYNIFKNTHFTLSFLFSNCLLFGRFNMKRIRHIFHCFISFLGNLFPFFNSAVLKSYNISLTSVSNYNIVFNQHSSYSSTISIKGFGNIKFRFPFIIKFNDFIKRYVFSPSAFKVFKFGDIFNNRLNPVVITSENITDFLHTHSTSVKFNNPVSVDIIHDFNDYVYTFETNNQMYEINGIIARNCRCVIGYKRV